MLLFIMFGSTPVSGHGNIFEPCKWYRALYDCTKKRELKMRILSLGSNLKKKRKDRRWLD